ncbi:MAG: Carnitine O-acetyltransferase mitochondrial [Phylliscum demangeonii]|nr:MAG: Carnitine O-acetyltransferase mitochondrial [Phylliscum demangeonii]
MAPSRARQVSHSAPSEGVKEDPSKGAMLRFQDGLPRLPVPTLQETVQRYLKSVHPLLNPSEFRHTQDVAAAFLQPGGQGEELQKRLVARREDPSCRNWLIEWWNDGGYLCPRDPVVPYVSYFYSHRDDRRRRNPAKRAAAITTAALEFKKQVDGKTLEPEYMKGLPLSMDQYEWMFNCCRIPAATRDYPRKYPSAGNEHIVVIRRNQFFKVMHEQAGRPLNTSELELQFNRVYQTAEEIPAVGLLTSENRDVWAKARDQLLQADPANQTALETIESASFVVCLDDARPVTLEERAHQYWHGDGSNRWYDKPLQFIINDNGTSGFLGEHSMMDGTPTHRLNDYVNMVIFGDQLDFSNPSVRSHLPEPQLVRFRAPAAIQRAIADAGVHFAAVIGQHELVVQAYQGYGKALIKQFRCSPDAYVQLIIQLAYHKMYGQSRPTYESAATRRFQLGRTETCRSVSDESLAFCQAMADPSATPDACRDRFRRALAAHVAYISHATDGRGVDRHLLGLRNLVRAAEPIPPLFTDPAYAYSSTWFLSTSQLSSEYFNGYGWSQVVDDGYGIAYMINENSIQFNLVSKGLGCQRMSFYLNEAAGDLRDLLLPTLTLTLDRAGKAKL